MAATTTPRLAGFSDLLKQAEVAVYDVQREVYDAAADAQGAAPDAARAVPDALEQARYMTTQVDQHAPGVAVEVSRTATAVAHDPR